MLFHMKLQPESFAKVKAGTKTIELRLWDKKRQKLKVGDSIEFLNLGDRVSKIRARIVALHRFDSFATLYQALPLQKCGYAPEEIAEASPADLETCYSLQEQVQWGVVGIEIELLNWKSNEVTRTSRYISMLLRHKPEVAGLSLDAQGWTDVDALIKGVNKTHPLTRELLDEIVRTDEKQRYSFDETGTRIRANQGHSIRVDVELQELPPPEWLWHGTADKYAESIEQNGLVAKGRLYVHLSTSYSTAVAVGRRHGRPVVYLIRAGEMHRNGAKFYQSKNNIWLTTEVPACYLARSDSPEGRLLKGKKDEDAGDTAH